MPDTKEPDIRSHIEHVRPSANPSRDTSFQIGGISPPLSPVEQLETEMLNNSRPKHPENVEQQSVQQSSERLVHVGVRIPCALLDEIDALARAERLWFSEMVRRLLDEAVAARRR